MSAGALLSLNFPDFFAQKKIGPESSVLHLYVQEKPHHTSDFCFMLCFNV